MKRLIGAVAALGLTAGAAALSPIAQAAPAAPSAPTTTAVAAAPAAYTPPPIKWAACSDDLGLVDTARCGRLVVPLDYAKPTGTKIRLAVSRVPHTTTAAKYQGVMLVNPGGPGGSGVGLSFLGELVPNGAGDAYDWIGFDPRGVGSSVPALTCDRTYFKTNRPNYVPTTQALEDTWLSKSKSYAGKCDKAGGALLDHVKTIDSVKDMDTLRVALGQKQINFYGFSYGTYLGQVYSTLYPTHVRRMVLDGVVDPTRVWYKANLDQDIWFDKNIKTYFAWIAKYDSVYHLGSTEATVEKLYYAQLKALGKKPAGGKIGPDEWNDIFVSAAYYVYGWEDVASAFAGWVHNGDSKTLIAMYGYNPVAGADNNFAMYLATQCTDVAWPKTWYQWRMDNWITYAKAPFLTWNNVWYNAPCHYWGAKPGTPVTIDGAKAPGVLLIAETSDAATPYSGALKVRSLFPKSSLIEGVGGTTHAGSLSGVSCTDDTIAAYLTDGTLPTRVAGNVSDKQCDPVPQPDPTAPAASSKLSASSTQVKLRERLTEAVGRS